MANEIQFTYPAGSTLYFRVRAADGDVWNTSGAAFEDWAGGNVTDYDVALVDEDGGYYVGDFPASISAGFYTTQVFLQAGGSPAVGDLPIGEEFNFAWDGTNKQFVINEDGLVDVGAIEGTQASTLIDVATSSRAVPSDVTTAHSTTDTLIGTTESNIRG